MDADARVPEEPLPDLGESALRLRAGGGIGDAQVWPRALGSRQRLAVDLAADRPRQGVEEPEHGGDHVGGEPLLEEVPQARDREIRALTADNIGDQPLRPGGVLLHDDHGLPHAGMEGEHGLDLFRLDAEAAHLHLAVDAADELQLAVSRPKGSGMKRSAVSSG